MFIIKQLVQGNGIMKNNETTGGILCQHCSNTGTHQIRQDPQADKKSFLLKKCHFSRLESI